MLLIHVGGGSAAGPRRHPLATWTPPTRSSTSRPTTSGRRSPSAATRRRRQGARVLATEGVTDRAARERRAAQDGLHGLPQPAEPPLRRRPSARWTRRWRRAGSARRLPFVKRRGGGGAEGELPRPRRGRPADSRQRSPTSTAAATRPSSRARRASTAAAATGRAIYCRNVFPEMKVTWGTHPNNIGHDGFPGLLPLPRRQAQERRRPRHQRRLRDVPPGPGDGGEGSEDPGGPRPEVTEATRRRSTEWRTLRAAGPSAAP